MPYWIHRDGENVGPYELDQLKQLLDSGHLKPEELAIEEGATDWTTVGEAAQSAGPALPTPEIPAEDPLPEQIPSEPIMAELAGAKPKSKLPLVLGIIVGVTALGAGGYLYMEGFFTEADTSPVDKKHADKPEPKDLNFDNNKSSGTNDKNGSNDNNKTSGTNDKNGSNPVVPPPIINPPIPGGNTTQPETNSTLPILPGGNNTQPEANSTKPPIVPPLPEGNATVSLPEGIPSGAAYLPADTLVALQVAPKQILDKLGGLDGVLTQVLGPNAQEQIPAPAKMALNLLSPANLGIAVDQPVYLFVRQPKDAQPLVGLVLPVTDSKKFGETLTLAATAFQFPGVEVKDLGGFQGIAMPGMPVVAGLAPDCVVVLGTMVGKPALGPGGLPPPPIDDNECDAPVNADITPLLVAEMKAILAQRNTLMNARQQFAEIVKSPVDLGLWLNIRAAAKLAAQADPGLNAVDWEKIGNLDLAVGVLFGQGEVTVSTKVFYNEQLIPNWSTGQQLDKALLDAVPGNAVATLAVSAKMAVVMKAIEAALTPETRGMLEQSLGTLGLTWEKSKAIPGGDLVVSFTGIKKIELAPGQVEHNFEFLLGATLNDDVAMAAIINRMGESGLLEDLAQEGLELFVKDKHIYYGNSKHRPRIEVGAPSDPPVPPLADDARNLLAENDATLHISPGRLLEIAKQLPPGAGPPEIMLILNNLKNVTSIHVAAQSGKGQLGAQLKVVLKDRGANFLLIILREAMKQAQGGGGFPGGPPRVDPGPDNPPPPELPPSPPRPTPEPSRVNPSKSDD